MLSGSVDKKSTSNTPLGFCVKLRHVALVIRPNDQHRMHTMIGTAALVSNRAASIWQTAEAL